MSKQNSSFLFFLLLTLLCGIIFNAPYHNFQDFLAQGDHGRDLYAAQAVLRGELPYKDFWWVYGPLMPYYYALFFKMFGVKITSILLGKILANIAAGLFFFLAFAQIFPVVAAFTAVAWFMAFHQDFFFTYNHAGGIAVMLAAVWMHCAYIKTARLTYAWGALAAVFILGLIKINFAVTALIMTILILTPPNPLFVLKRGRATPLYTFALLIVPLCWFGIYAWFLQGLSTEEIRQCFPYLGGDEPYNHLSPLQTIPMLVSTIAHTIKSSWVDAAFCILILLSAGQTLRLLLDKKTDGHKRRTIGLVIVYAALFYALNLHEFLKSGVFYRAFWSQPFCIFLSFAVIAASAQNLHRLTRALLWSTLVLIAFCGYWANCQRINPYKNSQHFLGSARGGVYMTNDRLWIQTVVVTTSRLKNVLKNDESFFALPYDCLYYYLTDKRSPTRQLIFFDHIKIPFEQEQKIIRELEGNKTAAVLVSSRQSAREPGLGTLGVSYCPLIAQYINTNFTPVAKIGDWVNEPGWAWNHGTLILKKK